MKVTKIKKVIFVFITITLLGACNKKEKVVEENTVRSVKYEQVSSGGIINVKYSGSIKPYLESNLSFKVPGNIQRIYVKIGDKVKKGQLLAVIDNSSYSLQVKQAQAMYEQVKASTVGGDYQIAEARTGIAQAKTGITQANSAIEQAEAAYNRAIAVQTSAKQDFERYKKLYLNDNIAQNIYDNAKSGLDQANAAVDQAKGAVNQAKAVYEQSIAKQDQTQTLLEQTKVGKTASNANLNAAAAQVQLAKLQMSYTELRAPADGTIAEQMAETNENIGAGLPVFKLNSDSQIQAEIYVSETDINNIKIGDKANILIESLNKNYQGIVTEIGSSSTGFGGTYIVKIGINNADSSLKIGMAANVLFNLNVNASKLTLPLTAVNEDSKHNKYVYLVENVNNGEGTITKKEVTIGNLINNRLEILSGITGSEKVVTAGVNMVAPGQKVKLYGEGK